MRDLRTESGLHILGQSFKHRWQEQAWRNRHHTDFMLREIACHRKCHSDHAALGRAIGHLPYLPVESRHRRRVDDDASFSIKLVSRSRACCKFRSEEHTSELQSLMRISYAVFCLKKKKK